MIEYLVIIIRSCHLVLSFHLISQNRVITVCFLMKKKQIFDDFIELF